MSSVVNLDSGKRETKIIYIKDAPKKQVYGCPSCAVIPVKGRSWRGTFIIRRSRLTETKCAPRYSKGGSCRSFLTEGEISVRAIKISVPMQDKTRISFASRERQPEGLF